MSPLTRQAISRRLTYLRSLLRVVLTPREIPQAGNSLLLRQPSKRATLGGSLVTLNLKLK